MTMGYPGPLSPEEIARAEAYWGGAGLSSQPLPPPQADGGPASYFGPPAPVLAPVDVPPAIETRADVPVEATRGPAVYTPPRVASSDAVPAGAVLSPARSVIAQQADPIERMQQHRLGTFAADIEALKGKVAADVGKASVTSEGLGEQGKQKTFDAIAAQADADDVSRHTDALYAQINQDISDVQSRKVEPNRAYKDGGTAFAAVIGGMLGGLYQGLNRMQSNPFIDQMNRVIDRDIAAQEHDIATSKAGVAMRQNTLAQLTAVYKDRALAKAQLKNMMLEGAKDEISARIAQYDIPSVAANGRMAINDIERQKDSLGIQELVAKRAAAAAAGARAYQHQQDLNKNILEMRKLDIEQQKADQDAGMGRGGTDPVSMVPKDQRQAAVKELEERAKVDAGVERVNDLFNKYQKTGFTSPAKLDAFRTSLAMIVKQNGGPGLNSDKDFVNFIEPLLPTATSLKSTIDVKRNAIVDTMKASAPTPLLDMHARGWRGPVTPKAQEFGLDGKPK